jgi:hypothetical protein
MLPPHTCPFRCPASFSKIPSCHLPQQDSTNRCKQHRQLCRHPEQVPAPNHETHGLRLFSSNHIRLLYLRLSQCPRNMLTSRPEKHIQLCYRQLHSSRKQQLPHLCQWVFIYLGRSKMASTVSWCVYAWFRIPRIKTLDICRGAA